MSKLSKSASCLKCALGDVQEDGIVYCTLQSELFSKKHKCGSYCSTTIQLDLLKIKPTKKNC